MTRHRGAVFQLRLSTREAEQLEAQAEQAGMSKADLIRTALGWDITGKSTHVAPNLKVAVPEPTADPVTQPGKRALQELAVRLGRKS